MKFCMLRKISIFTAVLLFNGFVFSSYGIPQNKALASSYDALDSWEIKSYENYTSEIAESGNFGNVPEEIIIPADKFTSASNDVKIQEAYGENNENAVLTFDKSFVEWQADISVEGYYQIKIDYIAMPGKGIAIKRHVLIDGEVPFYEAQNVTFFRTWQDVLSEDGQTIIQDSFGNDLRPSATEVYKKTSAFVKDTKGYTSEPLKFYLSKGVHTIRLTSVREPMAICGVSLIMPTELKNWKDVQNGYKAAGYQKTKNYLNNIQAETASYKSDSSIVMLADRSSASTQPNDPYTQKYNSIGAEKWQQNGQWLSWTFTVPESGLYKIAVKARQNTINGSASYRNIYIDGKIPFNELSEVKFSYDTEWKVNTLGESDEPYLFYFEANKQHEIKMEVTLGEIANSIKQVNDILTQLNQIYREILVVTGAQPDVNRDYEFATLMPETIKNLKNQSEKLKAVYEGLINLFGANGESIQILKKLYMQGEEMAEKPDSISKRFSNFQSNLSALGSWVISARNQPLTLDYLVIASPDKEIPDDSSGFFSNVKFYFLNFLASFSDDYSTMTSVKAKESIKVWLSGSISSGRDQAQILKALSDNYFTGTTNIPVNLQLVAKNSILPATLAKIGPDVALSLDGSDPINFAVRNAVLDLTEFDGFKRVSGRFSPSALTPFTFNDKVYALPETQQFPMLFYRKDILKQLNLEIPKTWDDVITMLPVLQKKQMNFGLPSLTGAIGASMVPYSIFLYQGGGQYYDSSGTHSYLNSDESVSAFRFLTSLYVNYRIPITADFLTRFRLGSTPIGIADYGLYNQLSVFAPDLEGMWDFTSVPGTQKLDGTLDRTVAGTVTGCVIFKNTKQKNSAWEFLEWWTSPEIQANYGTELESIMGSAARYSTANLEAMNKLPWSEDTLQTLNSQWEWVRGNPEVPGGYYTPRYLEFAIREVVNNEISGGGSAKVIDYGIKLSEIALTIDSEIDSKRKEFGLSN